MTDVRTFGAQGDGVHDDTDAIQRAVADAEGGLLLPAGEYRISKPIEIELKDTGPLNLSGSGGCAALVMSGPGPALHIIGTHDGTAGPDTLRPDVLARERLPTLDGLCIVGAHPQADGVRLEGLWQPTLTRLYIRECRHGIHVRGRNRNLIIANCHVHNNSGVGVFYDHLNLHQSNILGSHISYNKGGGIKVLESEIRNLQINANDIEYNYASDAEESADVWIETLSSSVREGTIVGNTIQALPSPNGANVRIRGRDAGDVRKAGNWTITGNLISSQMLNLHLCYTRGVAISGNSFFSGHDRTMHIEDCECIAVGTNTVDRHPDYRAETGTGITIERCVGCNVSGLVLARARSDQAAGAAVVVDKSRDISIANCQILDPEPCGIALTDSENCLVSGCLITDRRSQPLMRAAIRVTGGRANVVSGNSVSGWTDSGLECEPGAAMVTGNAVQAADV